MALTIYTKDEDEKLIEAIKIKAIKEKTSVSETALQLLKMWVDGKIKLNGRPK